MKKVILFSILFIAGNIIVIYLIDYFASLNRRGDTIGNAIAGLIFYAIFLLLQLIAGTIFINTKKYKKTGQGLLLAAGFILLVGFSMCSGIFR